MFRPSRSSNVIDFEIESTYATSYYYVIVTLVISCTISEILQVFCVLLTPPLFYPNLGVFPLHQIAHAVVNVSRCHKLLRNYFRSIPTYVITVPELYRRTDGRRV